MAITTPKYISELEPYQGGRPIKEVSRELGIPAGKIVKLASNENPLGVSPKVKSVIDASVNEIHRYPDGNGYYLKLAISKKFSLKPEQIILGNGSNDILELAARTVLSPGDEVIYSKHAFAVYEIVTKAIGAVGKKAIPEDNFGHNLNEFLKLISKKTKLIFIANPNNPTGNLIEKSKLLNFLSKVPKNILVVLDEAYDEYLSDDCKSQAFNWLSEYKNLMISRSFSKAHGLAGLRIGYGVGDERLINLINRVRQPFNVNYISQVAAIESLRDDEFIKKSRSMNDEGKKQLEQVFREQKIQFIPSYGNFISFNLEDESKSMMYYQHLLKNGIIVRPISNYELPSFLRVSIGLRNENDAFIKHIRSFK
ncbi:MAG: histidinol-phosphate transaminase [Nitrosomonadales bacterium]|nr:histidinol-phosphate transaminase [Nitrosomonadales bacterium]